MNSTHDVILPEPENYRAEMEQAIREIRQAINEALGYIQRQEDGPLTMTYALRSIHQLLSALESESWYLTGELDRLRAIAAKLLEQRDEAIRQRDLFMLFAAWSNRPDNQ